MTNHNASRTATVVPNDAFSSGQVGSKLWLCEELEKVLKTRARSDGETIWIYGGWQGLLGFMLLSRPTFARTTVRSFDLDSSSTQNANVICENWVWRKWQFRAFTADCNQLDPRAGGEYGSKPSIVINTSVEHFDQRDWFEKIPLGTLVVLQASDFEHDGAVSLYATEEKLMAAFPLAERLFSGRLNFEYDSWGFNRFMLIGIR